MVHGTYPFGQPVLAREPARGRDPHVFVLGAYPSAVHVRWSAPGGRPTIGAIPIDNEPEPFWDGADATQRVEAWRAAVAFDASRDGRVASASANGSSGQTLTTKYLDPLALSRADCWITDCLDTYRTSVAGRKALIERFPGGAGTLQPHPSQRQIIAEAIKKHLPRLRSELDAAKPTTIITLGEAANQVFGAVLGWTKTPRLTAETYGDERTIDLASGPAKWLPLAHPGVIAKTAKWRQLHAGWVAGLG
jgi:uracil-DNA glycosylase